MYSSNPFRFILGGVTSSAAAEVTFVVLMIVGFVVAIVGTVLIYQKYIGAHSGAPMREAWSWRTFWRFDKLLIEPILKVLYIFNALFAAFATIALIIATGVGSGVGGFFLMLLIGAILCFFQEVVLRICYELLMLVILIRRDANDIRFAVCGGATAPTAPAVEAATDEWVCPSCGHTGNTGAFCPKCGVPRA